MERTKLAFLGVLLIVALAASPTPAQSLSREYDDDDDHGSGRRPKIDRYLDVDVWTNHADGDYYVGDNIVVNFRANRDAFVVIYSIDSRGRVNLLFPTRPDEDNFVEGDRTYNLPGGRDNYDLVVTAPAGSEQIQAVASRERFPIPDWYRGSGLVCGDNDDRDEYLDWLNGTRFVRYGGQRFAYDRTTIFVRDWEPDYFRPIFYPAYPSWSVCGNIYIDYPWGGAIYVNGMYWGCAPLYIPRILVGWHTITVYDPWGACWEHDVHVSRYNTLVLDRTVIQTRPEIRSKFKEVREVGYRDPVRNGYPRYAETIHKVAEKHGASIVGNGRIMQKGNAKAGDLEKSNFGRDKKYVHGTTQIVETGRGLETKGSFEGENNLSTRKQFRSKSADGNSHDYKGSAGRDESTVSKRGGDDLGNAYRGSEDGYLGSRKSTGETDRSADAPSKGTFEVDRSQQSGADYRRSDPASRDNNAGDSEKRKTVVPSGKNGEPGKSEGSYRRSGGETKSQPKSAPSSGGKSSSSDSGKKSKR